MEEKCNLKIFYTNKAKFVMKNRVELDGVGTKQAL